MKRTMYICLDCGSTFDEDEIVSGSQWDGEGVMGGWHSMEDYCPSCGSDNYEEAERCMYCDEYFGTESQLNYFHAKIEYGNKGNYECVRLCDECLNEIKRQIANGIDEFGIAEEIKN